MNGDGAPARPPGDGAPGAADTGPATGRSRPLVERLLLMLVALAMSAGFFVMGIASWAAGEPALGVFGLIGGLMTLWVGGLTLRRG